MPQFNFEPRQIRAVALDAVGTLLYPDPPVAEAYHAAGRQYGATLDVADIAARFGPAMQRAFGIDPKLAAEASDVSAERFITSHEFERQRWRRIVGQVFRELPAQRCDQLFEALWRHFEQPSNWRLFDDVEPTWRRLEAAGLTLAIASNFDRRLHAVLDGLPPLNGCRRRFISADVGHGKPSRPFFRAVVKGLGLPPEHVLMVGDNLENDYQGARAAGLAALHLDRSLAPGESAVGTIRSLSELTDFGLGEA